MDCEGRRSLTKKDYNTYLGRFRAALHQCCGFSKAVCREFGLHSLRSGGDTHLYNIGLPASVRMEIGQWATPTVERGYLRTRIENTLQLIRAAGL